MPSPRLALAGHFASSGVVSRSQIPGSATHDHLGAVHRNAVQVGTEVVVGTLKANKNRTVALPTFGIPLAQSAKRKGRDDLLWPSASGGYMDLRRRRNPGCRCGCPLPEGRRDFSEIIGPRTAYTAASLAISAGANRQNHLPADV